MILVTGATGNVGRELVELLARAGHPVRALIRREADRARFPAGVEGVVGDLNRPETLSAALDGVRVEQRCARGRHEQCRRPVSHPLRGRGA